MANETVKRPVFRPGGVVLPTDAPSPRTGSWRSVEKPAADIALCVNCLLCWAHCPDSAVVQSEGVFKGFDFDYCKGCGVCAEVCPTDALRMVPEEMDLMPGGFLPGTGGAHVE